MGIEDVSSIGLVLSGGGAKGAFQVGFLQALEQHGLWNRVTRLSGSSIGAMNALLATTRSATTMAAVWDSLSMEAIATSAIPGELPNPFHYYPDIHHKYAEMTLEQYLVAAQPFPFTQQAMAETLQRPGAVDWPLLEKGSSMELWCCAYNMETLAPDYFCLNGRTAHEAVTLTLASCCIPILLPPVAFGGALYCDGGLVPPYYSGPDNSDKIPLKPLLQDPPELLVVVYLSLDDALDLKTVPAGTAVLEVYPTQPLESAPGMGTLDFSAEAKDHHRALGLADGARLLATLERLLAEGLSLQQATQTLNAGSHPQRLAMP